MPSSIPTNSSTSSSLPFELSEAEQMRIINETGILNKVPHYKPSNAPSRGPVKPLLDLGGDVHERRKARERGEEASDDGEGYDDDDDDEDGGKEDREMSPLMELAFDCFLWLIPFCFLFIGMDIAIHQQYHQPIGFYGELQRLSNVLPGLILIVFATLRYPTHRLLKTFLFLSSLVGGSYMIYIINREGYLKVMRRCPPLGVLWIWSIVHMDLGLALVSLAGVGGWFWYTGMKIIF